MDKDKHTTVFKGQSEEINAEGNWFSSLMLMNLGYYLQPSRGDLKFGGAIFEINAEHKQLMDYLDTKCK